MEREPLKRKPNVAVVGYGYAGRCFHAYLVELVPDMVLRGISSRNEETRKRIEKEQAVHAYSGLEEALADPQVDLVVLATPHDTHAELAVQVMDAGKHVVTDKVMCLNLEEADRMIEAANRNGALLSVFHNRRWDGGYLTLKRCWESGMLGKVFHAETCWSIHGRPRGWRAERKHGGGRLYDLGAHMIDQAVNLAGSPVRNVLCRMHRDIAEMDVESHVDCLMTFESGLTWLVQTSCLDWSPRPRWKVMGTEGTFVKTGLDPQEKAMVAGDIDSARESPENKTRVWTVQQGVQVEMVVETIPGRWRSFYEDIAAALIEGREPAITARSVRPCIAVIDAAFRSAESGESVPVG